MVSLPALVGLGYSAVGIKLYYGGHDTTDDTRSHGYLWQRLPLTILAPLMLSALSKWWTRRQNCIALRWGTSDEQRSEADRPQFIHSSDRRPSPIHGREVHFFSSVQRRGRQVWTTLATILMGSIILCFISAMVSSVP